MQRRQGKEKPFKLQLSLHTGNFLTGRGDTNYDSVPDESARVEDHMIKEAVLYHPLEGGRVKCTACARYCNIPEGKVGFCGVRQNIEGKLQLLVYGKVITGQIDPIEKKPVVHYHPGSKIFSIATTGCSWACDYCQNAEISQRRKAEGVDVEPSGVVEMALTHNCQGLARSGEHTSELQSRQYLVCRLLL